MIKINDVDSIQADANGMTIKCGEHEIFLSWEVVDEIGEASEPHYFEKATKEITILSSQKKIN